MGTFYELGDVVRPQDDGPEMIVESVGHDGVITCRVRNPATNEYSRERFHKDMLKLVKPKNPEKPETRSSDIIG